MDDPPRTEVIEGEEASVVVLTGEFDGSTVDDLRAAFTEAMHGDRAVVDLTETTFIDSTVIGAFVVAQQLANDAGVHLTFLPGNPIVMRTLAISGVDEILNFSPP